eukprot:PRCOL_00005116-RA
MEEREVQSLTEHWELTLALHDDGTITRCEGRGGLAALQGHSALLDLAAGAFAGVASMTATAPLEVLKARRIASRAAGGGMAKALASVMGEPGGWRNLFAGNGLKCLAVAPNRALDWFAYTKFKDAMLASKRKALRGSAAAEGGADEAAAVVELSSGERFVAGAAAGCISKALTYPLDLLSNRAMVPKGAMFYDGMSLLARLRCTVAAEGGAVALGRGLGISLVGILPYAGVNYGMYDALKGAWLNRVVGDPSAPIGATGSLACGVVAGWAAMFVSYPIEVLRRRVQLECLGGCSLSAAEMSTAAVARAMYREGGLPVFYRGLRVASTKIVPMAAVSFVAFEGALAVLRRVADDSQEASCSAAEVRRMITLGAAAGQQKGGD